MRPPVLHLLLDGVPHHQDHGRGGKPDDRVPWQLQDRRQRPNCDVADHRPKSEAEVPAPHHQQLRAVQQVSRNHFNGWHNGVSELDNHSLLARLLRWCPSPDCSNAVKVRKWKQRMAKIKFNVYFLLVNYSKPDSKSRRKLFLFKVQHVEARPVKCACGHTFCFSCRLSLMHSPPSRLSLILIFSAPSQQAMTWLFSARTGTTLWGATWSRSGLRSVMTTGVLRSNGHLIDC